MTSPDDIADEAAQEETLRNGGPTKSEGLRTTTGSSAGPGGAGRPPQRHIRPAVPPQQEDNG